MPRLRFAYAFDVFDTIAFKIIPDRLLARHASHCNKKAARGGKVVKFIRDVIVINDLRIRKT